MDWIELLGAINYGAVVVAVLSGFVVGMVWYAPQVFGELWRKEAGLSKKDMDSSEGMAAIFGGTAVFNFITAAVLAAFFSATGVVTLLDGVLNGAILGFAIASLPHGVHALFERKSYTYIALNTGHNLLTFMLMGAILGAWL